MQPFQAPLLPPASGWPVRERSLAGLPLEWLIIKLNNPGFIYRCTKHHGEEGAGGAGSVSTHIGSQDKRPFPRKKQYLFTLIDTGLSNCSHYIRGR